MAGKVGGIGYIFILLISRIHLGTLPRKGQMFKEMSHEEWNSDPVLAATTEAVMASTGSTEVNVFRQKCWYCPTTLWKEATCESDQVSSTGLGLLGVLRWTDLQTTWPSQKVPVLLEHCACIFHNYSFLDCPLHFVCIQDTGSRSSNKDIKRKSPLISERHTDSQLATYVMLIFKGKKVPDANNSSHF